MTRAPNHRLAGQKRDRASFVRALRTEGMQLIAGLQHQYALPAYRNDNELILLQLRSFIARQMCWTGRSRLGKRFKVTDDRIRNAHEPCEEARAQNNVEEMAARRWLRSRVACHTADDHEQFRPIRLRIFSENSAASHDRSIADFFIR